jgi:hypothetical protein
MPQKLEFGTFHRNGRDSRDDGTLRKTEIIDVGRCRDTRTRGDRLVAKKGKRSRTGSVVFIVKMICVMSEWL